MIDSPRTPPWIIRWFRDRFGNPLEWSSVDRCLLWLALVGPWPFATLAGLAYLKDHPEQVPVYDWEFLNDIVIPFYAITSACVAVLVVGALLSRRRSPENPWIIHGTLQGFMIHSAALVYFTGTLTTIMWIAVAAGLMVLALLFEPWAVFWASVSATILITATFIATVIGWIPYAPFFAGPPFENGRMHGTAATLLAFYFIFAFVLTTFFFLFLYAVSRWREHERKLTELLNFLRQTFGRYLSKDVLDALIENPDAVALGGDKKRVTILITDLRGFTQFSERLDPQQLVRLLNRYFRVMMEICEGHQGTVNDIIGDALLVTFGAPQELENHARAAVACAIEMQNAMAAINADNVAEGLPQLEMGIGLNTDEVVVGNIGSERRSKFGVIGSGVNLASRIESATVGGQVLASQSTVDEAGKILRIDARTEIQAKGAEGTLLVYEVGGIGAPHNLALDRADEALALLPRSIAVSWQRLDGKAVSGPVEVAAFRRLSRRGADLDADGPPETLTNLKLNLTGVAAELAAKDFYAKVIAPGGDGDSWRLRFTALPPEVGAFFEAYLHHSNGPEGR